MPQAIERLLATPMISPRLPRISPENSGMQFLVAELATLYFLPDIRALRGQN
jgi:hypothetical protein